jgi:hypothetical protein
VDTFILCGCKVVSSALFCLCFVYLMLTLCDMLGGERVGELGNGVLGIGWYIHLLYLRYIDTVL